MTESLTRPAFQLAAADVLAALQSDANIGLSDAEAQRRLAAYGPNELASEPPIPRWRRLLAQFTNVLVLLLLAATVISVIAWLLEGAEGLPYEAFAIIAIVIVNALIGFFQEERAEDAVAALRKMTTAMAVVLRDGRQQQIDSHALTPGDILLVEEGNAISADGRLIGVTSLQMAEAALTGESQPVTKTTALIDGKAGLGDRTNMIFSGTVATFGRGRAVVIATGMNTEMGKIAGLMQATPEEKTPLSLEIEDVGRKLGIGVVLIAVLVIVTILLVDRVTSFAGLVETLVLGVSLAVAAVPEGLPTILTVVLALGVQRMVKRNAIVRKLAAVETLGSASVICSDKTGTLTKNEMTVRTVITPSGRVDVTGIGYAPTGDLLLHGSDQPVADPVLINEVRRALQGGALANNAVLEEKESIWAIQGDPTEAALVVAARKIGLGPDELNRRFQRVGEVPFSSDRKLMSTVQTDVDHAKTVAVVSKGAPDVLLTRCTHERVGDEIVPLSKERCAELLVAVEMLAGEALRTLGIAYRRIAEEHYDEADEALENELIFVGIVGIIDPPRPEAQEAVATAQRAGIRVIMITGDHPVTAATIAAELNIVPAGAKAIRGADLEQMDSDQLLAAVREHSIYARVSPEHKLRIIQALRADGHVVAMTGDGVNDAPALKRADIGVAMGITGTDVSKEAADMILTDDNFATIVAAVEEGRSIFDNIRKFLRYLISSNIGEVLTMFLGVVLAGFIGLVSEAGEFFIVPLLATQILWINLLTDAAPALAVGVDPVDPTVMQRAPRPRHDRVINREMWLGFGLTGLVMAVVTLAVMDIALPGGLARGNGEMVFARTLAFTTLVFCQLFNVFNARSDYTSAFRYLFSNWMLWGAVALSAVLQVVVVYTPFLNQAFGTTPIGLMDWVLCIGMASMVLWVDEIKKLILRSTGYADRRRQQRFEPQLHANR
ncbi:cation-translocating P-type ATPase [Caldilinea sp.]|uniref:cation-translocating P-type ATPase n=1 Tax=Caldilinea sp. TaxID=2293560 RepID=UPI0031CC6DC0